VKTLGFAGMLGLSCVAVATGLAASPPAPAERTAPKAPDPITAGALAGVATGPETTIDKVVVSPTLSSPAFQASTANLVTPEALQEMVSLRTAHPRPLGPDVECMAKVVYHEAANQALAGQLAVAQVILNRVDGGPTFPKSVCGVVNQQGQFFTTRLFKAPSADLARWRVAVAIAFIAQERRLSQVAPGALFYHAAFATPGWSRQHQRIARIGDQVFYR
jgi:spore germination cell wall hydrolase CwlJ-like protein